MRKRIGHEDLESDPMRQFEKWYREASRSGSDRPEAFALATSSRDGKPMVRMMLMKGFDDAGFVFFTNYGSQKARQIDENPRAELLFYWPDLGRQVRIAGRVERVSRRESAQYFATRPFESKLAARVSPQSRPIPGAVFLEEGFRRLLHRYRGKDRIPLPAFWGGYRLSPEAMEFWQEGPHRLHDRFRYEKDEVGWTITRLAP